MRATRAEIALPAIAHNVAALRRLVAPASVLAVVKADGYGHGAVEAAGAALEAGAERLGVATVEEGMQLRAAGIAEPILVLSQADLAGVGALVEAGLDATVYTPSGIDELARAAESADRVVAVHLKVDTGMRRVGAATEDAVALARQISDRPGLRFDAVWTHCAVADEPDNPFTEAQLDAFDAVVAALESAGLRPPLLHAANSAAAIAHPRSRYDLVRCGIAIYGIAPSPALEGRVDLQPAMRLVSTVSFVKRVPAGTGVSYGHAYRTTSCTTLATVPIGYADGVPRRLSTSGGEVLIGGRRRPIAGVVTMDQLVVDCGDDQAGGAAVSEGDEVVLLGAQGGECITADEWAALLGTIAYEIVCGIGPRVPRRYLR